MSHLSGKKKLFRNVHNTIDSFSSPLPCEIDENIDESYSAEVGF